MTTRRQARPRVTTSAFQQAARGRVEDVAALYGLTADDAKNQAPDGMILAGWLWHYPDGSWSLVQRFATIGNLFRPVAIDALYAFSTPRSCQTCARSGGELTENGCPTCGPTADIL